MSDAGSGDRLARGAHSAQFELPQVTQTKWNEAFGTEETEIERLRRKKVYVTEEESIKIEEEKKQESKLVEEYKQVRKFNASSDAIPFRAVQDRVVVVRLEEEEEEKPLLETPDETKEKPSEGLVVAVGPGKYVYGQFVPTTVAKGDRVLFGKYAGQEIKVGPVIFLVLREDDIFVVRTTNQNNPSPIPIGPLAYEA